MTLPAPHVPEPRRVLIATAGVGGRTGTETYTRDLALALLRRGWLPIVFTTSASGAAADELRAATIPVVDDLTRIGAAPHVIHGHHHLESVAAIARFPGVPALFVSHDASAWNSVPPRLTRIGAYVAVDRNCRDRMLLEHGLAEDRIRVLANAVDLRRFARRGPLPPHPRRALVFSNAASEFTFVAPIREACRQRGIELDVAGEGSGNFIENPEQLLGAYDVVFGKARCALEAAATGAAVIVCDWLGLGGMVTSASVDAMRALNFGARMLRVPITVETVARELDRYDPDDAATVCDRIRESAGVDLLAEQFIGIYEDLIARPSEVSPADELAEISRSLTALTRQMNRQGAADPEFTRLRQRMLNSRVFALPIRMLYRVKKRLESRR